MGRPPGAVARQTAQMVRTNSQYPASLVSPPAPEPSSSTARSVTVTEVRSKVLTTSRPLAPARNDIPVTDDAIAVAGLCLLSGPSPTPAPVAPVAGQESQEPIYVNPKQLYRITRRREQRKRYEAMFSRVKFQSRQRHAERRVRDGGGRFVPRVVAAQALLTVSQAETAPAASPESVADVAIAETAVNTDASEPPAGSGSVAAVTQ
jgi:hypothetical protein